MSDHGLTYGSNPIYSQHPPNFRLEAVNVKKIHLGQVLKRVRRKVKMVVGSGAYAAVYPMRAHDTTAIVETLRNNERTEVDVYTRDEIPEELHYRVRNVGIS